MITELVGGETLNATKLNLRRTLDCAVQIAAGQPTRNPTHRRQCPGSVR